MSKEDMTRKRITGAPKTELLTGHPEPKALGEGNAEEKQLAELAKENRAEAAISTGFFNGATAVILAVAIAVVGVLLFFATRHAPASETQTAYYSGPTKLKSPAGQLTLDQLAQQAKTVGTPAVVTANLPEEGMSAVVYLFDTNESQVPENSSLTALAEEAVKSGRAVVVRAYTDPNGSVAYNNKLSQKRAKAVGEYLIAHGVDRSKVSCTGLGPTDAFPTDAQGRRAEVTLQ